MRTILISGASRGIGYSIAEKALKEGHRISVGLRNTDALRSTAIDPSVIGDEKLLICNYDANDPKSAETWVKETISKFKTVIFTCDTIINM